MNPLPEKVTLRTMVRSFGADHPDFETEALTYAKDVSGNFERDAAGQLIKLATVETGIVAPRLVNSKPAYNDNRLQNRGQTTTGRNAFDLWFSGSHAEQYQIDFDFWRRDDAYMFEDRAFFPLNPYGTPLWNKLFTPDGEGLSPVGQTVLAKIRAVHPDFGQGMSDVAAMKQRYDTWQVRNNNYHFTLEAEATFIYRGDEDFAFFGDDDLWVFIDDKLVMDLGGLHPPVGCQDLAAARRQSEDRNAPLMPGYLNLRSTNPRNRSFSSNTLRLRLRDDLGIAQADEYLELVLMVGQPYKIKLFYAERHTLEANCCFYHTLQFAAPEPAQTIAAPAAWSQPTEAPTEQTAPELVTAAYAGTVPESAPAPTPTPISYTSTTPGTTQATPAIATPAAYAESAPQAESQSQPVGSSAPTSSTASQAAIPMRVGSIDLNDPNLWNFGDRIICVTPVRTVIRREEEITLIRRVRKVEEIDASPTCPANTTPLNQNPTQG